MREPRTQLPRSRARLSCPRSSRREAAHTFSSNQARLRNSQPCRHLKIFHSPQVRRTFAENIARSRPNPSSLGYRRAASLLESDLGRAQPPGAPLPEFSEKTSRETLTSNADRNRKSRQTKHLSIFHSLEVFCYTHKTRSTLTITACSTYPPSSLSAGRSLAPLRIQHCVPHLNRSIVTTYNHLPFGPLKLNNFQSL